MVVHHVAGLDYCTMKQPVKSVQFLFVGTLAVKQEKDNRPDHFTLVVMQRQSWSGAIVIISHISREFSQYFWTISEYELKMT